MHRQFFGFGWFRWVRVPLGSAVEEVEYYLVIPQIGVEAYNSDSLLKQKKLISIEIQQHCSTCFRGFRKVFSCSLLKENSPPYCYGRAVSIKGETLTASNLRIWIRAEVHWRLFPLGRCYFLWPVRAFPLALVVYGWTAFQWFEDTCMGFCGTAGWEPVPPVRFALPLFPVRFPVQL